MIINSYFYVKLLLFVKLSFCFSQDFNINDELPNDIANMVSIAKRIMKPYTIPKVDEIKDFDNLLQKQDKANQEMEDDQNKLLPRKRSSAAELKILEDPLNYIKSTFEAKQSMHHILYVL